MTYGVCIAILISSGICYAAALDDSADSLKQEIKSFTFKSDDAAEENCAALRVLCERNYAAFVEFINIADDTGSTLLHRAVQAVDMASVAFLCDAGACVDVHDAQGCTPLHLTACLSSTAAPALVTVLLDRGADPDRQDNNGKTAYDHVACYETALDTCPAQQAAFKLKAAMENRLSTFCQKIPSLQYATIYTILHQRIDYTLLPEVEQNRIRLVKAWLDAKLYMHVIGLGYLRPRPEPVHLLLKRGADPDVKDSAGATVLYRLMQHHDFDNQELLVTLADAGADPNIATTTDGNACLHAMAQAGVHTFIYRTPDVHAAYSNYLRLLLRYRADYTKFNFLQQTPIDVVLQPLLTLQSKMQTSPALYQNLLQSQLIVLHDAWRSAGIPVPTMQALAHVPEPEEISDTPDSPYIP